MQLGDDANYGILSEFFVAFAVPTRLKIMHALLENELCTCEIAAVVGASNANVSQHLRVLRSLRLVNVRRNGKFVHYRLHDGHVATILRTALAHQAHPDLAAQAS